MSTFVTRSGSQLLLNSAPFRFAGCNIYWLASIVALGSSTPRIPTTYEVNSAFQLASQMGATVVRSHTLGISTNYALAIEPSLGTFNTAAFAPIDYAIWVARQYGIKLIIPLTDNYHYYHGGKHDFTDWRSISDETQFYSNATVISDFEQYINTLLTHVNTLTGVSYANDPTILAWETGNELSSPTPSTTWTTTIANYIKSIDSNHLVIDGSSGINSAALSISNVDIYSNHFYPPMISIMSSDAATTSAANKAYIIGEVDWRPNLVTAEGTANIDKTIYFDGVQSLRIDVISGDAHPYHVQVLQPGLSLSNGITYTVSFYAKAALTRTIEIAVQQDSAPYTVYSDQTISLTTSWQQYTFSLTMTTTTSTFLAFNCAAVSGSVWIDLVSITATGVSNLVQNASFESATISPWTFNLTSVTPSPLSFFESAIEANVAVSGDLFWSLLPHATANTYTSDGSVFSLYYPGQDASTQSQAQLLRTHAYTMSGLHVPGTFGNKDGFTSSRGDGIVLLGKDGR